jgi:hypothetical protein
LGNGAVTVVHEQGRAAAAMAAYSSTSASTQREKRSENGVRDERLASWRPWGPRGLTSGPTASVWVPRHAHTAVMA